MCSIVFRKNYGDFAQLPRFRQRQGVRSFDKHFSSRRSVELLSYFTTVSQCLGIEHPCGTCDQILLRVGMLLSEICGLVSVGRPLWREDVSPIYSVITHWFESLRTRSHTLLSHLRLPQPGGSGSRIYIPQEQGGPVIPPALGSLYDSQGYGGGILTLSQPGGPGSRIYIPQEQGGPVLPPALGSLYDSQGYGGGILTPSQPGGPGSRIYIQQE
jgi:putative component of toxin-antitoxin plasmid stabilization module